MYDRDYVKTLEREIELTGGNRFEGWENSNKTCVPEGKSSNQTSNSREKPGSKSDS